MLIHDVTFFLVLRVQFAPGQKEASQSPDVNQLRNLNEVYIEQDWFYMSTTNSEQKRPSDSPTQTSKPTANTAVTSDDKVSRLGLSIRTVPSSMESFGNSSAAERNGYAVSVPGIARVCNLRVRFNCRWE